MNSDVLFIRNPYQRSVMLQIADYTAPVLDLETLKVNKRASGRLRGLADLEELKS